MAFEDYHESKDGSVFLNAIRQSGLTDVQLASNGIIPRDFDRIDAAKRVVLVLIFLLELV